MVVRGGTSLARILASEHVRLRHGVPTIVIDSPAAIKERRAVDEADNASTLILSGRADAVAYEPESDPAALAGDPSLAEARR